MKSKIWITRVIGPVLVFLYVSVLYLFLAGFVSIFDIFGRFWLILPFLGFVGGLICFAGCSGRLRWWIKVLLTLTGIIGILAVALLVLFIIAVIGLSFGTHV